MIEAAFFVFSLFLLGSSITFDWFALSFQIPLELRVVNSDRIYTISRQRRQYHRQLEISIKSLLQQKINVVLMLVQLTAFVGFRQQK